jgi:hypothetical protein
MHAPLSMHCETIFKAQLLSHPSLASKRLELLARCSIRDNILHVPGVLPERAPTAVADPMSVRIGCHTHQRPAGVAS